MFYIKDVNCNRCLEVKKAWSANHPETKCEHQRRKNDCGFCAGDSLEDALFGCVRINGKKEI